MQGETTPQTKVHPHYYTRVLFHHQPHEYQPRNVNRLMEAEKAAAGFNTRVAVALTKGVGTMWTAYIFTVLAFVGLLGLLNLLNPITFLLATWIPLFNHSQQAALLLRPFSPRARIRTHK